eukprot:3775730-Pleurochrysis_carterae.AAC.1
MIHLHPPFIALPSSICPADTETKLPQSRASLHYRLRTLPLYVCAHHVVPRHCVAASPLISAFHADLACCLPSPRDSPREPSFCTRPDARQHAPT